MEAALTCTPNVSAMLGSSSDAIQLSAAEIIPETMIKSSSPFLHCILNFSKLSEYESTGVDRKFAAVSQYCSKYSAMVGHTMMRLPYRGEGRQ